jgi:hypothetical protein
MRDGRIRPMNPKVAAFAFLGAVLWIYKWYRPDGAISEDQLVQELQNVFFGGMQTSLTTTAGAQQRPHTTGERAQ